VIDYTALLSFPRKRESRKIVGWGSLPGCARGQARFVTVNFRKGGKIS
jgi:hypothetical protein